MKKPTLEELDQDQEMEKLTVEKLDMMIKVCEKDIEEWEESLRHNIEWATDKRRYEIAIEGIKNKKGRFYNLLKKYTRYKLKKSANKPPKKLNKDSRKFLEEMVWKRKRTIVFLKEYKKDKKIKR